MSDVTMHSFFFLLCQHTRRTENETHFAYHHAAVFMRMARRV
jgi:hypothetical protein